MARQLHPGQRNSLDALCKRYEVDASGRNLHGALIDSELLARVYLAMTGGQTALSLDAEVAAAAPVAADGPSRDRKNTDLDLVVVRASAAENEAHEAMLDKLRQSGACLWDEVG